MLANKFILPQNKIYMCGHSLGPSLKRTAEVVNNALGDFALYGVNSWNKSGWIDLPYVLSKKIAELIGAKTDEVIVCDSTIVNLYKVLNAALQLQKGRKVILTTDDNFPADLYIAQRVGKIRCVKPDQIFESIDEQIALVMLTHVNYRDASVFDMQSINTQAHKYGALAVWDLSHSTGIVPLDLQNSGADFAVGCTYKYLSGGPGSPAFIYANKKHHSLMKSPIQGWMGHNEPFAFKQEYTSSGIKKFMGGTPPILSMKALQAALEVFDAQIIEEAHTIANEYSTILIEALISFGIEVYTPKNRGGHVAFTHQHGYAFSRALIDAGFICDYRAPGLVRLCVNPLYISVEAIESCAHQIKLIIENKSYLKLKYTLQETVT